MIVAGVISDKDGLAHGVDERGHWHRWACPAASFNRQQQAVTVTQGHGGEPVGKLAHLEMSRDGKLWALSELRNRPEFLTGQWFYSYEAVERDGAHELVGLCVTRQPASVSLPPLRILNGATIHQVAQRTSQADGLFLRDLAVHANQRPLNWPLTITNHPDDAWAKTVATHLRDNWGEPADPKRPQPPQAAVDWQGGVEWSQHQRHCSVISVR